MLLLLPLPVLRCSVGALWGCRRALVWGLHSPPGYMGAEFLTALLRQEKGKGRYQEHHLFTMWWTFTIPLLPPKCQQGREGGGHGSFPDRECPPTPPVRAVTGGSRRGKQIWEVAIGTEQLRVLGSAFRSTPYLHVFVHDCYEIHKPYRRRLSCQPKATRYRLYFTAVCREVKNCITTDYHFQKKLYSAELRTLCSAFRIVLFLSSVCRQQRSLHG